AGDDRGAAFELPSVLVALEVAAGGDEVEVVIVEVRQQGGHVRVPAGLLCRRRAVDGDGLTRELVGVTALGRGRGRRHGERGQQSERRALLPSLQLLPPCLTSVLRDPSPDLW